MSSPSAHDTAASRDPPARGAGGWWRRALGRPLRTASFWAAIGLPALYVPLLVMEPATDVGQQLLVILLVAHALAVWGGRSHRQ